MGAYILAVVDKHDIEKYQKYAEAGFRSIDGFDVKVTVTEQPEVLEGKFPGTTTILLKFKSVEEAKRWYFSDPYQAAIPLRHAAADTPFTIIIPGED